MLTLNGWEIGLPLKSPPYTSLRPASADDTQKAPPPGFSEMPQALTRVGSVIGANPGWSEMRSVARYAVLGRKRFSSPSTSRRRRAGQRRDGRAIFLVAARR